MSREQVAFQMVDKLNTICFIILGIVVLLSPFICYVIIELLLSENGFEGQTFGSLVKLILKEFINTLIVMDCLKTFLHI